MKATVRRIALLRMLPRNLSSGLTASELASNLNAMSVPTTVREVRRDLEDLSSAFPIADDEAPRDRRYWWEGTSMFDIPAMTPHTALTFLLADDMLERLMPPSVRRAVRPHVEEAKRVVADRAHGKVDRWLGKVKWVPRHLRAVPAPIRPSVLDAVYDALFDGRQIRLSYQSRAAAKPRWHVLHPLGVVYRNATVELIAQPDNRAKVPGRYLLHRARKAQIQEEPAVPPAGFELQAFLEGDFAFPFTGEPVRLEFDATAEKAAELRETALSKDQVIGSPRGGWVPITATVRRTPELRRWLLSQGPSIRLREPSDLREALAQDVRGMAAHYDSD